MKILIARGDLSTTKWDIFHYVYAILLHPDYRQRYAADLCRELPRIPFVGTTGAEALEVSALHAGLKPGSSTEPPSDVTLEVATKASTAVEERPLKGRVTDPKRGSNSALPKAVAGGRSSQATGPATVADIFRALVKASQRLAEIHVHYEQQHEYLLKKIEKKGEQIDYRVEKMKLNKAKTQIIYNKFLTLDGFPPETYEYRLGNRSALEWIIDQYQVSTDKRNGITNDPNREDDPNLHPPPHRPSDLGQLGNGEDSERSPEIADRRSAVVQPNTGAHAARSSLNMPAGPFTFNYLAPLNPPQSPLNLDFAPFVGLSMRNSLQANRMAIAIHLGKV